MTTLRFGSLFSGIEAASVAWKPLGWECAFVAEVDPYACALLAHHYPGIPNLGDVTAIDEETLRCVGPLDVIVGGSPCQDLSTAGRRAGLAGERSGLFHYQVRIFHAARDVCGARFLVWENVPGAFSSDGGRDFAVVVSAMAGADIGVPGGGWSNEGLALGPNGLVEWCVLDAQWFNVAQRRERVFAVLDTGAWTDRPPILLEPDGLRGDSPPRRATGEAPAGAVVARAGRNGGASKADVDAGHVIAFGGNNQAGSIDVATALNASGSARMDFGTETLLVDPLPFDTSQITSRTNRSQPRPGDPCHPLTSGWDTPEIAFDARQSDVLIYGDKSGPLDTEGHTIGVYDRLRVRRLTPRECERLQGFPDDYTLIPYRGKPAADGPRYKALGNSMAVPVMHWIGRQIQAAVEYQRKARAA